MQCELDRQKKKPLKKNLKRTTGVVIVAVARTRTQTKSVLGVVREKLSPPVKNESEIVSGYKKLKLERV